MKVCSLVLTTFTVQNLYTVLIEKWKYAFFEEAIVIS